MDKWRAKRARGADAARALQIQMDRIGVPDELWEPIQPLMARTGYAYIELGTLTVEAVEKIAKALEALPQQRTVPDAGDDEPDHARASS